MADKYLEDLLNEYKGRKSGEFDFEAASDPYAGLVPEDEMNLPLAPEQIDPAKLREEQIQQELDDVKLQQQEHKLLAAKSQLGKQKVKNDANEFNEYSIDKELKDDAIKSYDKDALMETIGLEPQRQSLENKSFEVPKGAEINKFREVLGQRESSGDYKATRGQYLGKYQFGDMALEDLGYKDEKGEWTGKSGITSDDQFLGSSMAQEMAMEDWENLLDSRLKKSGALDYVGEYINGTEITKDGLKAAAHLVGANAVTKMLKDGQVPEDALGTKATDYLNLMNPDTQVHSIQGQTAPNLEPGTIGRNPTSELEANAGDMLKTREDGVEDEIIDRPVDVPADVPVVDTVNLQEAAPLSQKEKLINEYKALKASGASQEVLSSIVEGIADIGRASLQRDARKAAAQATRAGAKGITGNLGFKPLTITSDLQKKNAAELARLQTKIEKLNKPISTQIVTVGDKVKLINKDTGEEVKTLGEAKKAGQAVSGDRDANSEASKMAREKARMMYPGLKFHDSMTEYDIEKNAKNMIANARIQDYYKPKVEMSKDILTERVRERARKWADDNQEDLKKQIKEFNSDSVVKKSKESIAQMSKVRDVLKSKNPIGDASIPTFMSRGTGEVGALTEEDKRPFGGSRAITSRIGAIAEEYKNGQLTKENRKYLYKLANTFEKADLRNMRKIAETRASQYGDIDFPAKYLVNKFLGVDDGYLDPNNIITNFDFEEKYEGKKGTKEKAVQPKSATEIRNEMKKEFSALRQGKSKEEQAKIWNNLKNKYGVK